MDGSADGMGDGSADGLEDGSADGLEDGSADGLGDGSADGLGHGSADGLGDRLVEGLGDGSADGLGDRLAEGLTDRRASCPLWRMSIPLALAMVAWSLPTRATARDHYPLFLPHGSTLECDLCHDPEPPLLSAMGIDAEDAVIAGEPLWPYLHGLDSDGDGFTNGEELGDPAGEFRRFGRNPPGPYFDPNDPNSRPAGPIACGNNRQDPGEACDSASPIDCRDLGFALGQATCMACVLDATMCSGTPVPDAGANEDAGPVEDASEGPIDTGLPDFGVEPPEQDAGIAPSPPDAAPEKPSFPVLTVDAGVVAEGPSDGCRCGRRPIGRATPGVVLAALFVVILVGAARRSPRRAAVAGKRQCL